MFERLRRDFSLSATLAGLIALFATFSGPVLIVVQAAQAGQLGHAALSTWIWSLAMGAGIVGLALSLKYRMPVIGAWSTPGVALLITGLTQFPFAEVVGCYLVLALVVTALGFSGLFGWIMERVPTHLLSAMIAGVLFQFCTRIFQSLQAVPGLVLPIVLAYVALRRLSPRYAVAGALAVGLVCSLAGQQVGWQALNLDFAQPQAVMPEFSLAAMVGLGLPLILLAITQYAASIHVLRHAGYDIPSKAVVGLSGLVSVPLSVFGNCGTNPAAIVGAICASPECHTDPARRYVSGVVAGVGYLVVGVFGASVLALFSAFPVALTTTLAGLALLGTLVSSLSSALSGDGREAALITFLVTVSGMSFFGLGSSLWGLMVGMGFGAVLSWKGRRALPHTPIVAKPMAPRGSAK